jgi:hypothetical protein
MCTLYIITKRATKRATIIAIRIEAIRICINVGAE